MNSSESEKNKSAKKALDSQIDSDASPKIDSKMDFKADCQIDFEVDSKNSSKKDCTPHEDFKADPQNLKGLKSQRHTHFIESYLENLYDFIGEDSRREGLQSTASKLSELNEFLYSGYKSNISEILKPISTTQNDGKNEMIVIKNIEFYSMCEHHLLPFFGKISIGYIPQGKIVGISDFAKIVEIFARRLQIQENLTNQIADAIMKSLKPNGLIVVCKALHLCVAMRGVKKQNARILTGVSRGVCDIDSNRADLMRLMDL